MPMRFSPWVQDVEKYIYMYTLLDFPHMLKSEIFSKLAHQENMSVKQIPPRLYKKNWGISIFLIFNPKHRLWVLVRTASARRFLRVPTINVLSKHIKINQIFPMKFSIFNAEKYLCILHGQVFVML